MTRTAKTYSIELHDNSHSQPLAQDAWSTVAAGPFTKRQATAWIRSLPSDAHGRRCVPGRQAGAFRLREA